MDDAVRADDPVIEAFKGLVMEGATRCVDNKSGQSADCWMMKFWLRRSRLALAALLDSNFECDWWTMLMFKFFGGRSRYPMRARSSEPLENPMGSSMMHTLKNTGVEIQRMQELEKKKMDILSGSTSLAPDHAEWQLYEIIEHMVPSLTCDGPDGYRPMDESELNRYMSEGSSAGSGDKWTSRVRSTYEFLRAHPGIEQKLILERGPGKALFSRDVGSPLFKLVIATLFPTEHEVNSHTEWVPQTLKAAVGRDGDPVINEFKGLVFEAAQSCVETEGPEGIRQCRMVKAWIKRGRLALASLLNSEFTCGWWSSLMGKFFPGHVLAQPVPSTSSSTKSGMSTSYALTEAAIKRGQIDLMAKGLISRSIRSRHIGSDMELQMVIESLTGHMTCNNALIGELNAEDYDHIVIIPDVHGDLEMFVRTLRLALIKVDGGSHPMIPEADLLSLLQGKSSREWSVPLSPNRRVAVVQLGDLMDRGPNSIECFRVMQNVERVFGWKTLSLYGNHEAMNMAGETAGYINPRDLGGFTSLIARLTAVKPGGPIHKEMNALHIGMVRLTGIPDDESGKQTSTLFVHGGVEMGWLRARGLLSGGLTGSALVHEINLRVRAAASTLGGITDLLLPPGNPMPLDNLLWTRRLAGVKDKDQEFIGCGDHDDPDAPLNRILSLFEVSRIVVGHTPQFDHEFKERCGGRIILADIAMSQWITWVPQYQRISAGFPAALFMTMDPSSHRLDSIVPFAASPTTAAATPRELEIIPIEPKGIFEKTCSVQELRRIGSFQITELLAIINDHPADAGSPVEPLGHDCIHQLIAVRIPPVMNDCDVRHSDPATKAVCAAIAQIRRVVTTLRVNNEGMCGSASDHSIWRDLNLIDIKNIVGLSPVEIATTRVSPQCRECLIVRMADSRCTSICDDPLSGMCDECKRLAEFASIAFCLVEPRSKLLDSLSL